MPQLNNATPHALTLTLLAALLTACASAPQLLPPPPVKLAQIPPLPAQARQPARPEICSAMCSSGLQIELESWLTTPTGPALPARPASAATKP